MELPVVPEEVADYILAECFGRPRSYYELGKLCDSVGGRTSGAESGRRGEEWAFDLMTRWGLEDVHYEEFPVTAWTRGTLQAEAISPSAWSLTAFAHGNAPSAADITAPVFDIGHGERSDYLAAGDAVKGKIVLCDEGVAEGRRALHRSEKLLMAAEYGAAGLMIYSSASGGLPRTGVCCRTESPIPSIGISQEDGTRLLRILRSDRSIDQLVRIAMTNQFTEGIARNVIGEIRGSETPEEFLMAGGHLDSWDISQGATDNGLGSAIVLEMGRILAGLSRRPRRTLRFAIWAAEEVGLCGSHDYAEKHAGELDKMVAVFNFDMTADPYGFWAPKKAKAADDAPGFATLKALTTLLSPVGMRTEFRHKAGLHSDHQPFMLAGVQALALLAENRTQGAHYYHSVGDTFEKVSLPAMSRACAVGAHTLWALADSEMRPFPRRTAGEIRTLIDEADLYEALIAEGFDGEPMHVEAC